MANYADLHLHTVYSDGNLTPEELLKKSVSIGLSAISITDHDSIDGCIKAFTLTEKYNLEIITGIELSCIEDGKEYHLLGYNFDLDNKILKSHLSEFREARLKRAEKIIQKLKYLDVPINFDYILEKAGEAPITRPHIASAMTDLGYTSSLKEAFILYIGDNGPAYESKAHFSVDKGIKLINQAGGVAVLAHPGKNISQETLFKMIELGLDGIEVVHPMHSEALRKSYRTLASQYWLLETGGSDYHGNRDYDEDNFGKFVVPYSVVDSIKFLSTKR